MNIAKLLRTAPFKSPAATSDYLGNNTKFSVLWASVLFLLLLASLFSFRGDFHFDFANSTGKSLLKVLLDEPKKFGEKSPFKAVSGNKMHTIKKH